MVEVLAVMVVVAGVGIAVASTLAAYAQRRWTARGRAASAPVEP